MCVGIPSAPRVCGKDTPLTAPLLSIRCRTHALCHGLLLPSFLRKGLVLPLILEKELHCASGWFQVLCQWPPWDHGHLPCAPYRAGAGWGLSIRGPDAVPATPSQRPSSEAAFPVRFAHRYRTAFERIFVEPHWLREVPLSRQLCQDPDCRRRNRIREALSLPRSPRRWVWEPGSSPADFEAGILSSPAGMYGSV